MQESANLCFTKLGVDSQSSHLDTFLFALFVALPALFHPKKKFGPFVAIAMSYDFEMHRR